MRLLFSCKYLHENKERCTPLSKSTRAVLVAWVREPPRAEDQPLFPNARGGRLSAHGVHYLLHKYVLAATNECSSLKNKRVSPHVLRHYVPFLTISGNLEGLLEHLGSVGWAVNVLGQSPDIVSRTYKLFRKSRSWSAGR